MRELPNRDRQVRERLEYWLVLAVARVLGAMPRALARLFAGGLAWLVYVSMGRLRRVGERNLQLALPALSSGEMKKILHGVYRSLGWQLVEFCRMARYTRANTRNWIRTEGLEHYLEAQSRGKGVLIVTGHLGAWELSSFYHSLMGHPMGMVIRRLDNRLLDEYVNRIRCLHGNRVLHKDDFARGLLTAMRAGETVGILMDTNMTPPQGVFVDFFGRAACTASGLARVALKCCPASCSGSRRRGNTSCISGRSLCLRIAEMRTPTSKPRRSSALRLRKRGSGAILTSGCGFTAAGRRGRRGSRGCTRANHAAPQAQFAAACISLVL
jgi:KDO2-lipid IV(A) lauroyltransferase